MYCGKNMNSCKSSVKRHKAAWFNAKCKDSKKIYMESKKLYSENQTPDNKANVLTNRNAYNKVKRKAKKDYYENEASKLTSMSNDSPRKFWKYVNNLKKKSKTNKDELNVNLFFEHFKRMSNSLRLEGDDVNQSRENIDVNINIRELDAPISVIEIMNTIKPLKRNKSQDLENNVADFFIECNDFISPYLCIIYNEIFNSGSYPEAWSKGIIIPIFKKGDKHDPANYRAITLVNIMSKIFSLCLRNRINKWCENENVFSESQFGFRDKKSTTDAIFILHVIFFDVSLGLKQGEPLSPLLFILFINNIDSCINTDQLTENDVNLLSMYLLLFADDIVLFTTDPKSLQAQIDNVHNYSTRCKLKINVKRQNYVYLKRKSKTIR